MAQLSSCFALALLAATPLLANPSDTLLYADLNGDAKPDTIRVVSTADGYDVLNGCTITINGRAIGVPLEDIYHIEIAVRDLDAGDHQQELFLTTTGASDVVGHRVVRLGRGGPVVSNSLFGSLSLAGGGVVQVQQWMGFWSIARNYRLDEESMNWQELPQELYQLNTAGTTTKPVTLLSAHEPKAKPAAKLKPKTEVTIVGCIPTNPTGGTQGEDWYQIKTATGATGWLQLKDFRDKITIPWQGS